MFSIQIGGDLQAADYNKFFLEDNTQEFVAGESNTKWFARSDINWTDIIEVPYTDIDKLFNIK
jgi:hypothetical protein